MTPFKISIIGLGYVGLPLAVEFAKKFPVVGFDINESRVKELSAGNDHTLEVNENDLKSVVIQNNPFQIGAKRALFLNTFGRFKEQHNFYYYRTNSH